MLLAIIARERFGIGQRVDASLLGGQIEMGRLQLQMYFMMGILPPTSVMKAIRNPLYYVYQDCDGKWFVIAALQADRFWSDFCKVFCIEELEKDEKFCNQICRGQNFDELKPKLFEIARFKPRSEWLKKLEEAGIPAAPVNDYADVAEDPQVIAQRICCGNRRPYPRKGQSAGHPCEIEQDTGQGRETCPGAWPTYRRGVNGGSGLYLGRPGEIKGSRSVLMAKRILAEGNEAVGWGALSAGCKCFFGYPITPQNEIMELLARELPERGGVFIQSQCETGAINMLYGAATAGVRAMTSTASPGWALMQEGMSDMASANLPGVVVVVQRIGPGVQRVEHAQMDYNSVTKGGVGGYKNIVLAPASVQETHDLMQLAFHLADKYRHPVVVLTEGILGHVIEPLEIKTIDFGPLPEKDWAVAGRGTHKDGKYREIGPSYHPLYDGTYLNYLNALREKYRAMESELRYEEYKDAGRQGHPCSLWILRPGREGSSGYGPG